MNSINNPQTRQGENQSVSDLEQMSRRAEIEFNRIFNEFIFGGTAQMSYPEWNLPSPEDAPLIIETIKSSYSAETVQWTDAAEIYLLPFHSFADDDELNVRFRRKLPDANLNFKWRVLYFDPESGGAALYAAELLVLKRRIYEQGSNLKTILEIDLEAALPPFIDSYAEMKPFQKLFGLGMTLSAKLDIKRAKDSNASRQPAAETRQTMAETTSDAEADGDASTKQERCR